MKFASHLITLLPLLATVSAIAQEREIEEIIVEGEKLEMEFINELTIEAFRDANGRGFWYYKKGNFREALPYLEIAAKRGFKMAQARLGYLYLTGAGGAVEPDIEKAIGWLGVAAAVYETNSDTTPEAKRYYRTVIDNLPRDFESDVEQIVAEYTTLYGADATTLHCRMDYRGGTHIKRLKCDYEAEQIRAGDLLSDPAGVSSSIPAAGGGASAP